jgi:hypothetical protein
MRENSPGIGLSFLGCCLGKNHVGFLNPVAI